MSLDTAPGKNFDVVEAVSITRNRSWVGAFTRGPGLVGVIGLLIVMFVAFIGPLLAPHGISDVLGTPFGDPSSDSPLGTDYLGRDVLSRYLHGGSTLILIAAGTTICAYILGALIGLLSGFLRGTVDLVVVWLVDVVLSIPAMILSLLILSALGPGTIQTVVAMTVVLMPGAIRLVRASTLEASTNAYVEAAIIRGENTVSIVVRELLPNVRGTIVADFGVRLSWAAVMYASLSFLGLGQAPPSSDWGLMVSENKMGLLIMPLPVIIPALTIALFTVSVTLIADSFSNKVGGPTSR